MEREKTDILQRHHAHKKKQQYHQGNTDRCKNFVTKVTVEEKTDTHISWKK
jgi:hypothetical protein